MIKANRIFEFGDGVINIEKIESIMKIDNNGTAIAKITTISQTIYMVHEDTGITYEALKEAWNAYWVWKESSSKG